MSAFAIYIDKVRDILKDHFDGNENPPIVEQMILDKGKNYYINSYHPRRVAKIILAEAQKQAVGNRTARIIKYSDEKYGLALRDNPDLTKEQWAEDFIGDFFNEPKK